MLAQFDRNQSNSLTIQEMQEVMKNTQLDKKTCFEVWELSNPQRADNFDTKMFFIAMHLMCQKKKDPNLELPKTVPGELSVSAGEEEQQQPALQL